MYVLSISCLSFAESIMRRNNKDTILEGIVQDDRKMYTIGVCIFICPFCG
jgi:hypothetical protein